MTLYDLLSTLDAEDDYIKVYEDEEGAEIWSGWLSDWRRFLKEHSFNKITVISWFIIFPSGDLVVYTKHKEFKKIPTKLKKFFGGFAKFPYLCP